ncbi:mediator of RNA polymerase II transcription subunit 15 [Diaphorina citri]|uniref:Mediator of RNA polymerase II transcription subunit 15 n=1 Tax=Diaphorina citri TaxID=121845 RepID=A0A1S3DFZ9_DIACI|nr:mediator of RNA polymerase II transcription subunit 15 [Diaphorina citri]
MGLFSKVIVLSACFVLCMAQDYEYSINQDKVSVRQGPAVSQNQFQRQPAFQSNSFQRVQPIQSAQLSKFQSIPQVKVSQLSAQPQQGAFPQNQFAGQPQNQFVGQPQEFSTESQFAAAPARFQARPVSFKPAAASTYVPQNPQSLNGNQNPNSFRQPPVQSAPSFNDESDLAPAPAPAPVPVQQFSQQPQRFQPQQEQASFEQAPVRRPAKVRLTSVTPSAAPSVSPQAQTADDLALIQEQNAAAKYSFSSQVQNGIHDNSLQREEVRDGLALKGMYAYSDGFFKRTVQYEADENGYRVVHESAEPIGNGEGPQLNLDGQAQVATDIDGASHGYSITADDIVELRKRKQPFKIAV